MYRRTERPRRPAIPVALHALAVVLLAMRAMMREGEAWLGGIVGKVLVVLTVALVVAAMACRFMQMGCYGLLCVASASVCAAFVLSSCALQNGRSFTESLAHSPISEWEFDVASDPIKRSDTYRCRATARWEDRPVGDVWLSMEVDKPIGTILRCVGRFSQNGDDEWGVSSRMQGVWGTVRAYRILDARPPLGIPGVLSGLRETIVSSFDSESSEERALLAGCVSGSRDGLVAYDIDKTFSRCGSSHLIAVSGSHMAVISSLYAVLCGALRMRRPWRIGSTIVLNGLFVVLCGAPVSAIRAWIMTCSALLAGLAGRRSHAVSGVAMAGLVMVLLDPAVSGQLGFLLSITAVLGLSLFSSYATYVIRTLAGSHRPPRWISKRSLGRLYALSAGVCESLGASAVAQLCTLPVSLESFDEVSLVGPLANMALSIPFTLMVGMGMVAAVLCGVRALQALVLMGCDVCAYAVLRIARFFSSLPLCTLTIGDARGVVTTLVVVMLGVVLVFWPRVSRKKVFVAIATLLCVVSATMCRWRFFAPARVCVLDVGQGDAILVQEGSHALLVDTGPDEAVVSALARNHVLHLDGVLVTHLHADHFAGIEHMVGRVTCDNVYVASGVASHVERKLRDQCMELTGKDIDEIKYGDVLNVEGFALKMVWPMSEVKGDVNADSVELALEYCDGQRTLSGLLTGDAEKDETGSVIAAGDVDDIDFLKVGHHGSEVSLTAEEAQALDPEVSVASAGEGNSYGHPAKQCVETLGAAGSMFLCTKDVGDVEIRPGERGPIVSCQTLNPV